MSNFYNNQTTGMIKAMQLAGTNDPGDLHYFAGRSFHNRAALREWMLKDYAKMLHAVVEDYDKLFSPI